MDPRLPVTVRARFEAALPTDEEVSTNEVRTIDKRGVESVVADLRRRGE